MVDFPENPQFSTATSRVLALSLVDSTVNRHQNATPLCRIYFSAITDNEICIESIESIVSDIYQDLETQIEGPCLTTTDLPKVVSSKEFTINVAPNPMDESTTFRFNNSNNTPLSLEIFNATGALVRNYQNITGNEFVIQREGLAAGMYLYRFESALGVQTGKLLMK